MDLLFEDPSPGATLTVCHLLLCSSWSGVHVSPSFTAVGHHVAQYSLIMFDFSSIETRGSRLSKWRELAKTEEEKVATQNAKREHLIGVFADRALGRRLMVSCECSSEPCLNPDPMTGVLYLQVDGMDQVT